MVVDIRTMFAFPWLGITLAAAPISIVVAVVLVVVIPSTSTSTSVTIWRRHGTFRRSLMEEVRRGTTS
jgi:hypothetical protein